MRVNQLTLQPSNLIINRNKENYLNANNPLTFKGVNLPKIMNWAGNGFLIAGLILYGLFLVVTHPATQLIAGVGLLGYGGISSYQGIEHYHGDKINLLFNYDGHLLEFLKSPFGKQTYKGAGLGLLGIILGAHALVRMTNRNIQATDPNWHEIVRTAFNLKN